MNYSFKAWLIWGIAASFVLFQFLLQASTSVMIPCLMKAFHINSEEVGFLSASFFYTYLFLQIPAGLLVDKLGAKKLLLASVFLCALASGLFGFANELGVAEIARLIMGIATAPAVVCAMYLASRWIPKEKFILAAGLTEMLGMLGGAIGELFLAQCVEGIGWRNTMYLCMLIGFVLFILVLTLVQDKQVPRNLQKPKVTLTIWKDLMELIKEPQIWYIGLYAGLIFAIIQAFASLWVVPFLRTLYSVSVSAAALGGSLFFVGTAIFAPILGLISNWIGRRKPLMYIGALIAFMAMYIIIYHSPKDINIMYMWLFILGASVSTYVIPFALAREITKPTVRATALGFTNMVTISIGAPILQPLIGYILQVESYKAKFGQIEQFSSISYQSGFLVLLIAIILAFVITFFIQETRCHCLHD